MAGAAGALLCVTLGAAVGFAARSRCRERASALESWTDALRVLELLLAEERLPLDELLTDAADAADGQACCVLRAMGASLRAQPSLSAAEAFASAKPWTGSEQRCDRQALSSCFAQLGRGTAGMRAQAAEACLAKLRLLSEQARTKADHNGALYARLGLLGGAMVGIALW